MAATRELKRSIYYQPLGAAQAQVRVDKRNCQRPLLAHAPFREQASRNVQDASNTQRCASRLSSHTTSSALFWLLDAAASSACFCGAQRSFASCVQDAHTQSCCLALATSGFRVLQQGT